LKAVWEHEHIEWSRRSLEGKRHVYIWADGVRFNIRLGLEPAVALDQERSLIVH
jgi:hypothetical protein